MNIPKLYSTREVAEQLSLTERAIWRLTGSGELHPIKIGNKNRYTEADLMDFLARHNPGLVDADEELVED